MSIYLSSDIAVPVPFEEACRKSQTYQNLCLSYLCYIQNGMGIFCDVLSYQIILRPNTYPS